VDAALRGIHALVGNCRRWWVVLPRRPLERAQA